MVPTHFQKWFFNFENNNFTFCADKLMYCILLKLQLILFKIRGSYFEKPMNSCIFYYYYLSMKCLEKKKALF